MGRQGRQPASTILTASQAARRLRVKPATLYTYVSRGWLSSLPGPDGRSRCYLAEEVEALRERAEAVRGHRAVAATAIRWGQPVVDTAISSIGPEGPRYRGIPVGDLLPRGFMAVVAHLLSLPATTWPIAARLPAIEASIQAAAASPGVSLHRRLIGLLAGLADEHLADPRAIIQRLAVACAPGSDGARRAAAEASPAAILAAGWGRPEATAALDAALVLCADHELNASTFAARVAASTGAGQAESLCAALAALSGPRHGALSRAVEDLLADLRTPAEVARRLEVPGVLPGCGHRLYPHGDPRAEALLRLATPPDPVVEALVEGLRARDLPLPNLDMGLVGLRRALGLPVGSAMAIFAVGRTAGWLAHIEEERARGSLIRPRARYIGPGRA